jgi:hypothetical protein
MTLLGFIVLFVVVGFVLWLINTYLPLNPMVMRLLNVFVVLVLVLYVLQAFGLLPFLDRPLPRLR